jgi:hypothetical protein
MKKIKLNIKEDRKKIADIISCNLEMMVTKKTKKGIIINQPMVENVADCILLELLGAFDDKSRLNEKTKNTKSVKQGSR